MLRALCVFFMILKVREFSSKHMGGIIHILLVIGLAVA
jgi:hypothetical protein